MYEYIKGTVAEVAPAYAVIDAGGVGYYLHISLETYAAVEHASEARLYVHYVVREDAQLLYGFSTKIERELFRLLISVSGVGGNTARMILSTYSPRELQGIITSGNAGPQDGAEDHRRAERQTRRAGGRYGRCAPCRGRRRQFRRGPRRAGHAGLRPRRRRKGPARRDARTAAGSGRGADSRGA